MRAWVLLLGGLLDWALHFFLVYGIASVFPGTTLARMLTIAATLLCLGVALFVLRSSSRGWRGADKDDLSRWMWGVSAGGAGLAAVAIVFQGLPALLG